MLKRLAIRVYEWLEHRWCVLRGKRWQSIQSRRLIELLEACEKRVLSDPRFFGRSPLFDALRDLPVTTYMGRHFDARRFIQDEEE